MDLRKILLTSGLLMSANSVWEHIKVRDIKQELVIELNQEHNKEKEKPVY